LVLTAAHVVQAIVAIACPATPVVQMLAQAHPHGRCLAQRRSDSITTPEWVVTEVNWMPEDGVSVNRLEGPEQR
jgi:hypothetical protein